MRYLHSDPDILGGEVVIRGTRVPIDTLLWRLKDGYSLDRIQEMYNWVDRETLQGAINEVLDAAIGALPKPSR
ncbi:DUF433 domain-containing protein [Kitasatospora sp. RG8]|uniref:DUF433 domain-containing protein n=1 Tax=Kitasatospora sp. RG8 TaxID=2820815 RepID=UPI001ADFA0DD|nr:DUF433 domain-containing protein [Kitasatospora sp. RG8]MBP0452637.1 DUF433 domain-containing protein [Kitasatospora sp. RG8]